MGSQKKSPNKSRAGKLNLKFSQMKANLINIHLNYISSEGELQMILNYLDPWKVDQNCISNRKSCAAFNVGGGPFQLFNFVRHFHMLLYGSKHGQKLFLVDLKI